MHIQFTQTKNMTCIYNFIDKKHDIHIQFTQTKNMTCIYNFTDKKHDMHIQFYRQKTFNLSKQTFCNTELKF
jgi:hypothetical protein